MTIGKPQKETHPWKRAFSPKKAAEDKKKRMDRMYGRGKDMPLPRLKD